MFNLGTVTYPVFTIDANTKLLAHFDGTNGQTTYTTEDSGARTVTFVGTAQLSTAQKKFGTASLLLDGDSDSVTVPSSADWLLDGGTGGDFTISFWGYWNNITNYQTICSLEQDANNFFYLTLNRGSTTDNVIFFNWYSGGSSVGRFYTTSASGITASAWTHVAFVKSGSTAYIFINGISQAVTTSQAFSNFSTITAPFRIGYSGDYLYLNGYVDEFRVSNTARWTSNFTPPTTAYPNGQ